VRHEVAVGTAASLLKDEESPVVKKLKRLETMNSFYCDVLCANGYDSQLLRMEAPKRSNYVAVTAPQSLERVNAIKEAKTAGQLFYATGGRHINSDEFFKARELKRREPEIKKMQEAKDARNKYCKKQREAVIKKKGELTWEREKGFTVPEITTLCNWKKIPAKAGMKKRDLVDAYIAAPKPKIQKVWSRSEEEALQKLKSKVIELKETEIGVATVQMARAVTNNLANLDEKSLKELRGALADLDEEKSENVI
jgi:hypothetical protein